MAQGDKAWAWNCFHNDMLFLKKKKKSAKSTKSVLLFSDLLKALTAIFRLTSKLVIDLIFKALKKGSPLDIQHSPASSTD